MRCDWTSRPVATRLFASRELCLLRLLISLLLLLTLPLSALAKAPVNVPLGDAPTRGASDAPVVMVEFIDFQ